MIHAREDGPLDFSVRVPDLPKSGCLQIPGSCAEMPKRGEPPARDAFDKGLDSRRVAWTNSHLSTACFVLLEASYAVLNPVLIRHAQPGPGMDRFQAFSLIRRSFTGLSGRSAPGADLGLPLEFRLCEHRVVPWSHCQRDLLYW